MNLTESDDYVELGCDKPDFGVIFLHGLGASGHDFVPWVLENFSESNVVWRMPHAGMRSVAWLGNQVVPAWFNLFELSSRSKEDIEGLSLAKALVLEHAADLQLPLEKVFIMGFSQGAALALYVAATAKARFAGIAGFSGYLPRRNDLDVSCAQDIWISHGDMDNVLPISFFDLSQTYLSKFANINLTAKVFKNMTHEVNADCTKDFKLWFSNRISNESSSR